MDEIIGDLRKNFAEGRTRSYEWRWNQLVAMSRMIRAMREEAEEAAHHDQGKPAEEFYDTEIRFLDHELGYAMKHLRKWMRNTSVKTDTVYGGDTVYLYPEPRGVALIFGPWNYPLQLVLVPLIGAITAGCCCVLKPSEISEHSTRVLEKYFNRFMDTASMRMVLGGPKIAEELLGYKWDHIFFTGSTHVGRIIARKAADHLTSTTLELGGKCPVFVDKTAVITNTANRIVWAKFMNNGQTCVAPDHVFVPRELMKEYEKALISSIIKMYGKDVRSSTNYGRIISSNHFNRLVGYLQEEGVHVLYGGESDPSDRFISPTLVTCNFTEGTGGSLPSLMQEEIFGPILPIIPYNDIDTVIAGVRGKDSPLSSYCFSTDNSFINKVERGVPSGSLNVNDLIFVICVPQLPFGGVGASGSGRYHGKASFDAFTNYKSVMKRPMGMEAINNSRYPAPDKSRFLRNLKEFVYYLAFYNSEKYIKSEWGWTCTLSLVAMVVGVSMVMMLMQ